VNFHRYPVGLQIIILGNDDEEDILELRIYHLKLREGTTLFFHDALYASGVRCFLVSFVYEISFLFNFRLDVLDIVYNDNLLGHATLKGVFNILDETTHLPSLLYFRLYFRHARLDHEGQG